MNHLIIHEASSSVTAVFIIQHWLGILPEADRDENPIMRRRS